jgi:hypothetical protein
MALVPCPECERPVSDRASVCPGCGYPLSPRPAPAVVPTLALPGQTLVEAFFAGSTAFAPDPAEYQEISAIEVRLDGEPVGAGDGLLGFRFAFTTTPGKHVLAFTWCRSGQKRYSGDETRDYGRSEVDFTLLAEGRARLRLADAGDRRFVIQEHEPPGAVATAAAPQPETEAAIMQAPAPAPSVPVLPVPPLPVPPVTARRSGCGVALLALLAAGAWAFLG